MASLLLASLGARLSWAAEEEKYSGSPALRNLSPEEDSKRQSGLEEALGAKHKRAAKFPGAAFLQQLAAQATPIAVADARLSDAITEAVGAVKATLLPRLEASGRQSQLFAQLDAWVLEALTAYTEAMTSGDVYGDAEPRRTEWDRRRTTADSLKAKPPSAQDLNHLIREALSNVRDRKSLLLFTPPQSTPLEKGVNLQHLSAFQGPAGIYFHLGVMDALLKESDSEVLIQALVGHGVAEQSLMQQWKMDQRVAHELAEYVERLLLGMAAPRIDVRVPSRLDEVIARFFEPAGAPSPAVPAVQMLAPTPPKVAPPVEVEPTPKVEAPLTQVQPLPPEALAFNASIEMAQQKLREALQKVQSEHEGYLSPDRVNKVEPRIEGLASFRLYPGRLELGAGGQKQLDLLQRQVGQSESEVRALIDELPARLPGGRPLEAAVQKLAEDFPGILPFSSEQPVAERLKQVFRDPAVLKAGWTPARLAQFMRLYRRGRELARERLPHAPWFEGVWVLVDPDAGEATWSVTSGSSRRAVLVLNLAQRHIAEQILTWGLHAVLQPWAEVLFVMDPAVAQASKAYAEALATESPLETYIQGLAEFEKERAGPRTRKRWDPKSDKARRLLLPAGADRKAVEAVDYLMEHVDSVVTARIRQGFAGSPWLAGVPAAFAPPTEAGYSESDFESLAESAEHLAADRILFLLTQDRGPFMECCLAKVEGHLPETEREITSRPSADQMLADWKKRERRIDKSQDQRISRYRRSYEEGRKRFWSQIVKRMRRDQQLVSLLIRERVRLEYYSQDPRYRERAERILPEVIRLISVVLQDDRRLRQLALGEPFVPFRSVRNVYQFDWAGYFERFYQDLRTMFNGLQLVSAPPAAPQAGLEEAVPLQPGHSLYKKLFPAGMSALDNVASGPLREFLAGGYVQEGFPEGARFLLRVVPQTPAEAGPWQQMGFKPMQDLQAVRSAFFSNAERPPVLRTLPDGAEYLEFTMPADSSVAERDLPELSAIRFFPAGGVALFSSLTLPQALQEQISILRTIAQLKRSPSPDLKVLRRLVGQISSRYLTDQLVRLGDLEKVVLVGAPLGFPDEGSLRQFVDLAGFPAERLISEEERDRARKEALSREQEATFLQNARKLAEELDLERARQELTGSLEKLTQAPLAGARQGQYLDPEAIRSLRERIGRLGPTEKDWQDLRTPPVGKVRRRVLEDFARDRTEIQRGIRELPGLPLPKSALEQAAPRLLQEYPELSRRGDKDPVKFYTHFFRNAQVAKAGWTPLRVAQFLEEMRRTREAVLAQVPGAPWFETVFLAPVRAGVPYDVSFDPADPGKRHGWVFVLDPTLDSSRIPEWAPYLTLRLFATLLLTDDPVAEQVTRETDPDLETRDPENRVFKRLLGQVRRIAEKGLTDHPWLESSRSDLGRVAAEDAERFRYLWIGGKERSGHVWALTHLVEARIAHQLGGERVVPAMLQSMDFTLQAVESRLGGAQSVTTLVRLHIREIRKRAAKAWRKVRKEGKRTGGTDGWDLTEKEERFAKRMSEEKESEGESPVLNRVGQRWNQNLGDLAALAAIQAQMGLLQEPGQERLARIESLRKRLVADLGTLEVGGDPWKEVATGHWDSIYQRLLSGYVALVQGLKIRQLGSGGSTELTTGGSTPLTTGLEEAVASLAVEAPAAAEQETPLRFLADTVRGDARVLRLLQLAVLLNIRQGLPIQAAAVATEEEAAWALAQLPAEARGLFRQLVVTYRAEARGGASDSASYRAGDEADYQFARAVAEGMIPRFHPELAITTVEDPAVIHWFFEALQRLGVGELSSDEQQRVLELLEAA